MVTIAFMGAGSVVFTRQLVGDILGFPELAGVRFVLHDIDAERLAVAQGTALPLNEELGGRATVVAMLDRREALAGADFVINLIQVGGIAATITDLQIPVGYGLLQTIGDTTGVGGVFRALRTFPVLSALFADIRDVDVVAASRAQTDGTAVIVDTRTQLSWDHGPVAGALHLPADTLDGRLATLPASAPSSSRAGAPATTGVDAHPRGTCSPRASTCANYSAGTGRGMGLRWRAWAPSRGGRLTHLSPLNEPP